MESNGTRQPVDGIDWLTCSPKEHVAVTRCNELKCLFDGNADNVSDHGITADYYYLQPCDVGYAARNAAITAAVNPEQWTEAMEPVLKADEDVLVLA